MEVASAELESGLCECAVTHDCMWGHVPAETEVEGVPVRLLDTAGLREATDAVEALGVGRARAAAAAADIVALVYDAQVSETVQAFEGACSLLSQASSIILIACLINCWHVCCSQQCHFLSHSGWVGAGGGLLWVQAPSTTTSTAPLPYWPTSKIARIISSTP